ncbi:tubulin-folding cofactor B-like [Alnus glutinosa]|uniref:tubulin-folding cofactor B-like n=1 Tax=Alnus glutinosa TaxID=3517 RepID=UPI002D76BF11|nr:tubulin-folding cofactor B-like [Alnus glutinosa]
MRHGLLLNLEFSGFSHLSALLCQPHHHYPMSVNEASDASLLGLLWPEKKKRIHTRTHSHSHRLTATADQRICNYRIERKRGSAIAAAKVELCLKTTPRCVEEKRKGLKERFVEQVLMASVLQIQGDESVLLRVTHSNLKSFSAELRFSLQTTVESAKEKLWRKCGTSLNSMCLELYDDTNTKVSVLTDDSRPLGFCSPLDGPCTFRKFKEKLASQNPSALGKKIPDNYMEDLCANIKVGDRCEVELGAKRGVVKFLGQAEPLAPGFWVVIQYDEPLEKHDGMAKGVRYFNCAPLHSAIIRPDKVKVCMQFILVLQAQICWTRFNSSRAFFLVSLQAVFL